ncbi:RdgB/HAM1 family non-canonical purine NTP pyrophosphatase [Proteiniclasticum sp. C24MP]|uniref:RdgB/HAM1 family non-canonical purine NTP pyrophosphatase n=1 Tax=Proteiniclasticum sp. C24MP TaxID=3374101 RepID=UPI00375528B9
MKRLIIASNNAHKVKEIKDMLKDFHFEVLSLHDAGIDIEVEEDRDTFMGNAYKKASEIYETLGEEERANTLVLSDDSGLAVDHLDGAPGVYSARYAGVAHDDGRNNEKLLQELQGVPEEKRGAQFVTAMVLLGKDLDLRVLGEAKGRILTELTGTGGFGYDPLFYSSDLGKSFGVATSEEKNSVSHRGNALQNLIKELRKIEDRHRL